MDVDFREGLGDVEGSLNSRPTRGPSGRSAANTSNPRVARQGGQPWAGLRRSFRPRFDYAHLKLGNPFGPEPQNRSRASSLPSTPPERFSFAAWLSSRAISRLREILAWRLFSSRRRTVQRPWRRVLLLPICGGVGVCGAGGGSVGQQTQCEFQRKLFGRRCSSAATRWSRHRSRKDHIGRRRAAPAPGVTGETPSNTFSGSHWRRSRGAALWAGPEFERLCERHVDGETSAGSERVSSPHFT